MYSNYQLVNVKERNVCEPIESMIEQSDWKNDEEWRMIIQFVLESKRKTKEKHTENFEEECHEKRK